MQKNMLALKGTQVKKKNTGDELHLQTFTGQSTVFFSTVTTSTFKKCVILHRAQERQEFLSFSRQNQPAIHSV